MNSQLSAWILLISLIFASNIVTYQTINTRQNQWFQQQTEQVLGLEKKFNSLKTEVMSLNTQASNPVPTSIATTPVVLTKEIITETNQEERLTSAVAKTSPAVVSIVVSKNVPQLEVTYQNPFGDNPAFGDFEFRIPVYRQKGVVPQKVGAGTGFLVSSTGLIVTNKHVVNEPDASYTVLLSDGKQLTGNVIYLDNTNDLALLKIEGAGLPKVELGDSSAIKLGQSVLAIGNALGEYNNSVSTGIISGLNRTVTAGSGKSRVALNGVIQTDAAINPGNSGGPLLDLNGKVLGVNVATVIGSSNISFAIPINEVKQLVQKFAP